MHTFVSYSVSHNYIDRFLNVFWNARCERALAASGAGGTRDFLPRPPALRVGVVSTAAFKLANFFVYFRLFHLSSFRGLVDGLPGPTSVDQSKRTKIKTESYGKLHRKSHRKAIEKNVPHKDLDKRPPIFPQRPTLRAQFVHAALLFY